MQKLGQMLTILTRNPSNKSSRHKGDDPTTRNPRQHTPTQSKAAPHRRTGEGRTTSSRPDKQLQLNGSGYSPPFMESAEIAARRQRILMSILACPRCGGDLNVDRSVDLHDLVVDADLTCDQCGDVGVVRGYRASFHDADLGDGWVPNGTTEMLVDLGLLETTGSWSRVDEGLLGDGAGASVAGYLGGQGFAVELLQHPWSGSIRLTVGGQVTEVNLRSEQFGVRRVSFGPPESSSAMWSAVIESSADDPDRNQMVVKRVWRLEPVSRLGPPRFEPSNAGNAYPARFEALLDTMSDDAVILDVGGGDRRHPDPRVLNFEYMKFDRPDFFGNGLELPIRSNSVDLVLSQAVLEHVPDPQRAVDEIRRILKPGAVVYAEIAFMQPLHAVPFHFFNVTPHGASLLFSDFDVVAAGTAGGLEVTLDWIFRLVDAERSIGPGGVRDVLAALRTVDLSLSETQLDHVASFVHVEATAR
jgi:SAM-dependent methyltransferase